MPDQNTGEKTSSQQKTDLRGLKGLVFLNEQTGSKKYPAERDGIIHLGAAVVAHQNLATNLSPLLQYLLHLEMIASDLTENCFPVDAMPGHLVEANPCLQCHWQMETWVE